MKRLATSLFLTLTAVAGAIAPTIASADALPPRFVITGSGFGHGVGMSQIGAKGFALEGKSAPDILAYYFPGTTLSTLSTAPDIRVNIGHQLTYAAGTGAELTTSGSTYPIGSTLRFSAIGKTISTTIAVKGLPTKVLPSAITQTLTWNGLLNIAGMKLKYGVVNLKNVAGKLEVTLTLKLDSEYLYGVSEMSSSWPDAALQAQAISSRTYAIARMGTIKKECDCNLYSSKFDQVYAGYTKEAETAYFPMWKSAVDQSSSQYITFNNAPISVYFSSSTGGITQKSQDVWGVDYPYLTNVADPYSLDLVLNPTYAHWQRVINQADMAAAFGLSDVASLQIDSRTLAAAVLSITATSTAGTQKTLPVGDFKTKLKIPASWFQIN